MSMDGWDGYRASRKRIQDGWIARGVRNPVVLTGDVHRAWANNLKADYASTGSAVIGAELVTSSITSGGNGSGSTTIPDVASNPHLRFYSDQRGYVRTVISPTQLRADFRTVASVTEHGAAVSTLRSFAIQDGLPGLQNL
jgi:alkaline phosphatase D